MGTVSGKDITFDIYDKAEYEEGDPSPITIIKELIGGAEVATISTVADADDFGKQIWGKHLKFRFKSTYDINGATFSGGEDGRFYGKMYYDGGAGNVNILEGFLLQDDIVDPFLPPGSEVELTLTDGLGILRDVEITDLEGNRLNGVYSLIELISFCLAKTGLKLAICVADNLFESRNQNRVDNINNSPYDQIFMDSYSLMKDSNSYLDCYTILELLLPRYTRLCQRNGEWWIQRLFEHRLPGWKYTRFDWDGTKINSAPVPSMKKLMGHQSANPVTYFVENSTVVTRRRNRKSVIVRNPYQYPDELLDNYHFTRGDERTDIVSTFPDGRVFEIEGWVLKKGIGATATAPTVDAFIERRYVNGYEEGRTLVILEPTSGGAFEYIENVRPVFACQRSLINYSIDFKLSNNLSGAVGQPASHGIAIRLEGLDGSHWTVDEDGKWALSDAGWTINFKQVQLSWYVADQDEREFQSIGVNTDPLPVSGKVFVMLFAFSSVAGSHIRYANQILEVKPAINGSNTLFSAEKHTISQDLNFSAKEEYDLFSFDAPCRSLRGCLLVNAEFGVPLPEYFPTSLWVDMVTFNVVFPVGSYPANKKYSEMVAWTMWHMNKDEKSKLAFTIQGLDADDGNHHDLTHIFKNVSADQFTVGRWYLVTAMSQNWKTGKWTGTMWELHQDNPYTDFEGDYKHEYEQQNL
ncbi:MAG: hypothetical protein J0M30_14835 [Chitinophagales bacterium]|nr:hypothetical protein [Chitinophagales bacterium]